MQIINRKVRDHSGWNAISYINNISSGKTLPSMTEFFAICDYFDITPVEFFDNKSTNPKLSKSVVSALEQLDEGDLELTLTNIRRLLRK